MPLILSLTIYLVPMINSAIILAAKTDVSDMSIVAAARHSRSVSLSHQREFFRRLGLVLLVMISIGIPSMASANNTPRYQRVSSAQAVASQEVYLSVSQYELALIQVLSEICPPVLNAQQKANFNRAYNQQLRLFMPRAANPHQTLRQLTTQREYRMVLHNVRAWTASFPASENRALCREFASLAQM